MAHDSHDDTPEKPPGPSLAERTYFVPLVKGLKNTLRHMINPSMCNTQQYPEETRAPDPGYRGEHRLKRDELGREKCVACFLCSTACPSHCIEIVAEEAPSGGAMFRVSLPVGMEVEQDETPLPEVPVEQRDAQAEQAPVLVNSD